MSSSESFYWHDYETSGARVAEDRPLQFAGVRTDSQFNVVGDPLVIYCRLSPDCLPHPTAVRVTGISPYTALEQGLSERDFIARIVAEMALPGTCSLGYNSLRFDDEITRYTLYRNFFKPYEREYGAGRSRWDLIDTTRAVHALRPSGIEWPARDDGLPSFKLEDLTAANGIDHGNAHDALADVLATIALARLLRERQPALFDTLYAQRGKHALASLVDLNDPVPLVHVSGQFGARRSNLAVVLPLAVLPGNKNEIICADLSREPDFLDQTAEQVRRVLFAAKADLPADTLRPPLKTVKLNRAPVLLPATWVAGEPAERLGLDGKVARAALAAYRGARQADPEGFKGFIQSIYAERKFEPKTDPDTRLYDGFLGRNDEALLEKVRDASPAALATESWVFEDGRLPELLFRYRARNFPDSLSDEERDRWQGHCRDHLLEQLGPGWQDFHTVLRDERSRPDLSEQQTAALQALADYAEKLQATHARW